MTDKKPGPSHDEVRSMTDLELIENAISVTAYAVRFRTEIGKRSLKMSLTQFIKNACEQKQTAHPAGNVVSLQPSQQDSFNPENMNFSSRINRSEWNDISSSIMGSNRLWVSKIQSLSVLITNQSQSGEDCSMNVNGLSSLLRSNNQLQCIVGIRKDGTVLHWASAKHIHEIFKNKKPSDGEWGPFWWIKPGDFEHHSTAWNSEETA